MNRRTRKRLGCGEFDYLGFSIKSKLNTSSMDYDPDKFMNDLIDLCEANDLGIGGSQNAEGMHYFIEKWVMRGWKSSKRRRFVRKHASEKDMNLIKNYLDQFGFISDLKVGPLYSCMNYNWED